MQIHSKKAVGATWCPMQTGPAARWMGGREAGLGVRGESLTPSYPCQKQPIRRICRGGGWGNHLMLWEADQSRRDNVSTRKG